MCWKSAATAWPAWPIPTYGLSRNVPVPPERVLEIGERTSFDGEVLSPLDEEAVTAAAVRFCNEGVESIAVSLTHSYANPAHEQREFANW